MEKKHWLLFVLILLTALALRLWLAPMPGHVHDIEQLKIWTKTAVTGNPLAIYNDSTANYPPLGLLPLYLMGHLYQSFFSPEFDTGTTTLTALLKLPAITADLLTALILFHYLLKRDNRRWAFIALAAYALNPAVIYDSAWWGQLESLVTLPMLLSVIALSSGRFSRSWFWLAVAVLVKPQSAVIAPVILIGTWKNGRWPHLIKGLLTASLTTTLVLLPFILVRQLPTLISQIRASAGKQLFLTMNAHNFWFLVTGGRGSFAAREANPLLDTQPLIGPLTGWQIGLLIFLLWTALISYKLIRTPITGTPNHPLSTNHSPLPTIPYLPPTLFWASTAVVTAFYMLPAEAHERYLFPALALLVPLLPGRRPFQVLYLLFSGTLFLNLVWVDSAVPLPAFTENLGWGVVISAVNVGLLVYFLWAGNSRPFLSQDSGQAANGLE